MSISDPKVRVIARRVGRSTISLGRLHSGVPLEIRAGQHDGCFRSRPYCPGRLPIFHPAYETFALGPSPYGHSEVKLKDKNELEVQAPSGLFIGSEPVSHNPERRMKDEQDDDSTDDEGDDDSDDGDDEDDDSGDGQDSDGT